MKERRRLRLWLYRVAATLLGTLVWATLPGGVSADNCSGLSDCYGTVASALAATVGIALVLATVVSLPSILSALESMAARSLDPGTIPDPATAASTVTPTPTGDTDLSRGGYPDPQGMQSMARGVPGMPGQGGAPIAGGRPDLPLPGSPPDAMPPYQQATPPSPPQPGFVSAGGGQGGDMQDLGRGYALPPGQPPAALPQGQDGSPAQSLHDLSRAEAPAPPPYSYEPAPRALPGDLSRGAGPPEYGAAGPSVAPTGVGGGAPPPYGQDLGRGFAPGAGAGDATGVSAPAGAAPASFAPASPSGGDALLSGQDAAPGDMTPVGYRETGQDLSVGQRPVAPSGGGPLPQPGAAGGAEPGSPQGQTDLTRGQSAPATGGDQGLGRAVVPPVGGDQSLARGSGAAELPASAAAPTGGDVAPGQQYGAPTAQPTAGPGDLARSPVGSAGPAVTPPTPSSIAGPGPGLAGAGGVGPAAGDAVGSSLGAAAASQVLAQAPYLDHTAQLVAAAQGIPPGVVPGAAGAAASVELVHGLGLETGPQLDLGGAIVTTSADATRALRFLPASGTFEVVPLDQQARALLLVGAVVALDPSRGRAAFGRYLRWAESGAPLDLLERDPDLAVLRATGLTRIGLARRADVQRALGPADQEWASGNRYFGYRVAEWPGYLYVFEFDPAEILRNQGFVASPSPPADRPLAVGMTRDAVWSRIGQPNVADGWWPFERWRYRNADGRVEAYEFAHGILRRVVRV